MGTSQWLLEESGNTASSGGEYQPAGSLAPGMSRHRNFRKVRALGASIGNRDSSTMAYWPGNSPKPSASWPPLTEPSLLRSRPDGRPVFDSVKKEYG
jgi:hypothetical protein